jgi:hypothetical protein
MNKGYTVFIGKGLAQAGKQEQEMTYLTDANGNFVVAENHNGKLRAMVPAGVFAKGSVIRLRQYNTKLGEYQETEYTVTGVGREFTDKSWVMDEEDARSWGGQGETMLVRGLGQVQYAYLAPLAE